MRVFDSLDDVKGYFILKASDADSKLQALYAEGQPKGWLARIKQERLVGEAQAARAAYNDALAALDEVRPGFTAAFEALPGFAAVVEALQDTDADPSWRCPECDTYSGEFTQDGDYMTHSICGREGILRSFTRGTPEYDAVYDHKENV